MASNWEAGYIVRILIRSVIDNFVTEITLDFLIHTPLT